MGAASLAVAICGLVLACLSLGWQAANYVLTGGRIKVELRVGATDGRGLISSRPSQLSKNWPEELAAQGYQVPVVAVRVANVGRQPVTIERWTLEGPIASFTPVGTSQGPSLPHRLEVGQSAMWFTDLEAAVNLLMTTQAVLAKRPAARGGLLYRPRQPRAYVRGLVELADGRKRRSSDAIT